MRCRTSQADEPSNAIDSYLNPAFPLESDEFAFDYLALHDYDVESAKLHAIAQFVCGKGICYSDIIFMLKGFYRCRRYSNGQVLA